MNKEQVLVGMLIEDTSYFSFQEVCERYHIPKELLAEMIEYGLFSPQSAPVEQYYLSPRDLKRLESAFRLHRDLEVNLPGVALALDLLEQLEEMRSELEIMRKHF